MHLQYSRASKVSSQGSLQSEDGPNTDLLLIRLMSML